MENVEFPKLGLYCVYMDNYQYHGHRFRVSSLNRGLQIDFEEYSKLCRPLQYVSGLAPIECQLCRVLIADRYCVGARVWPSM